MRSSPWHRVRSGLLRVGLLLVALPLLYVATAGALMIWPPSARLSPEPAEVEAAMLLDPEARLGADGRYAKA